jgi:DNA-binding protein WhiA
MNFTSEIKKEIITQIEKQKRKLKKTGADEKMRKNALLSAYVRAGAELGIKDGVPTFFIVTETESVAEFFISAFTESFSVEPTVVATMDRLSGRDKLVLQCPISYSKDILGELGLLSRDESDIRLGIASRFKKSEEIQIAYVKGAFLSTGSCMIPSENGKNGYHLEFVFSDKKSADDFCKILWSMDLLAKIIKRKESYVVYIKNKEIISDFLSLIGVSSCLKKFSAVVEKRDEANQNNRAANCYSGNVEKTVQASVKQVMAIERLKDSAVFEDLSEELKALARFRLENPAMSLQELANSLKISKSCLSHRMRRLMELAAKLDETLEK